jgi:hypothetical protein
MHVFRGCGCNRNGCTAGWDRRMTHLAATFAENPHPRVAANLRPAPVSRVRPYAASHASGSGENTIHSDVAIFLEKRLASSHYSVIGPDAKIGLAPEIAGCHVLNAALSASSSRDDYAAARAPAGDKQHFNQTGARLRLRTGRRKINANENPFSGNMDFNITVATIGMMRIGENIHATRHTYATVAPILHRRARANTADRGTTSNSGAADADGR